MNSKHTPGPWVWYSEDASMATLCRKSDSAFGVDLECHVLSVTICKNCQQLDERWEWGRCYTANAANARLIASAPDLLDALERIHRLAQGDSTKTRGDLCDDLDAIFGIALNAILKARDSLPEGERESKQRGEANTSPER